MLRYLDLANRQARLKRVLTPDDLPRLLAQVSALGDIRTTFDFSLDDYGRPASDIAVEATFSRNCHLCLNDREAELSLKVRVLIAPDEATASEWENNPQQQDPSALATVAVLGEYFDATELVEDELLLALPIKVCEGLDCDQKPDLSYPAPADQGEDISRGNNGDAEQPGAVGRPEFAVLAALKDDKKEAG